jgi:hypothetical protein
MEDQEDTNLQIKLYRNKSQFSLAMAKLPGLLQLMSLWDTKIEPEYEL